MLDKKLHLLVILLLTTVIFFSCKQNTGSVQKNEGGFGNNSSSKESLGFDFLPTSTTNEIVKHDYYTLSYNEKYEQAEWVAYELKKDEVCNTHFERPFFIQDPEVPTHSADWRNYKKSGYDKGHLCPAGDMCFSKKAHDATFFTSNISPQVQEFNEGIWNTLENKVRYWAVKYDDIYIVTGGVLHDGLPEIGREHVAVPEYFYKIVLRYTDGEYKMIAFLVPNEDNSKPLYDFVVPAATIEKMTGIDFFPSLPDAIESKLEKSSDYKDWSFD